MKVAVSSTQPLLDAKLDPRFGRCRYLLIVDSETLEFEPIENPNLGAGGGAGVQTAQIVVDRDAEAVLTGNCGPNAFQTLAAAGIKVCVGLTGTVRGVVEAFERGEIDPVSEPSVARHFGVGGGAQAGARFEHRGWIDELVHDLSVKGR
jgi:predicted Fe-Mo cluster-binding NifX family protein